MESIKRVARRLLRDDNGASAVEYSLVVAGIAAVVITVVPVLVPVNATGPKKGSWVTLAPGARTDAVWRVRAREGDGAASPIIAKAHIQFRQGVLPAPLPPSSLDDPILDLDAFQGFAGVSDGEQIDRWEDQTASNNDAWVRAPSQGLPFYRANGFGTGIPAIEFTVASGLYQR